MVLKRGRDIISGRLYFLAPGGDLHLDRTSAGPFARHPLG